MPATTRCGASVATCAAPRSSRRSIGVTDYVFMMLLGVPLALPLAMLAFFSGYIPYFGGFIATGIILLVTYCRARGRRPWSRCSS